MGTLRVVGVNFLDWTFCVRPRTNIVFSQARKRGLPEDQVTVEFFVPLPERVEMNVSYLSPLTDEIEEVTVQTHDPLALSTDPADRERYGAQLRFSLAKRNGFDAAGLALFLGDPPSAPRWDQPALRAALADVKSDPGLEGAVQSLRQVVQNILSESPLLLAAIDFY